MLETDGVDPHRPFKKIVDLATNLILLSGLQPGRDIQIEFTGIRPGEKLYEELNNLEEDTLPTYHEKIKIFAGNGNSLPDIQFFRELAAARDESALLLHFKELIPDYNPSSELLHRVLQDSPRPLAAHA